MYANDAPTVGLSPLPCASCLNIGHAPVGHGLTGVAVADGDGVGVGVTVPELVVVGVTVSELVPDAVGVAVQDAVCVPVPVLVCEVVGVAVVVLVCVFVATGDDASAMYSANTASATRRAPLAGTRGGIALRKEGELRTCAEY